MNSILDSDEEKIAPTDVKRSGSSIISLVPPPETVENSVVDPATGVKPTPLKDEPKTDSIEGMRRSGLAYSAGIAFFASVVFMLVIGWGADLLFGSTPWGMVIGIVLGSVIGFVQFFRINSQIFGPEKGNDSGRMLMTDDDDDK